MKRFSLISLCMLLLVLNARGQYGPGWHNSPIIPNRLTPDADGTTARLMVPGLETHSSPAFSLLSVGKKSSAKSLAPASGGAGGMALMSSDPSNAADEITPEIQDLARGLLNDPVKIYDYVKNRIDYEHYFGSKKGAHLTMLERSGNDFDQCALLAALMRAAGYSVNYSFGLMELPFEATNTHDLKHWIGFAFNNTNNNRTYTNLASFFWSRGNPYTASMDTTNYFVTMTNTICFHRVWLTYVDTNSTTFYLDPSFKVYTNYPGVTNLSSILGFDKQSLMSAAEGTTNANGAQALSESGIGTQLTIYASNLLVYLRTNSQYPNAEPYQITGGRRILPQVITTLPTTLEFPECNTLVWYTNNTYYTGGVSSQPWTNILEYYMSQIGIGFTGVGTNYGTNILMPALKGKRLALTFETTNVASLWLDDTLLVTQAVSTASNYLNLSISNYHMHGWLEVDTNLGIWYINNYVSALYGRNDQVSDALYKRSITNGLSRHVLLYAFSAGEPLLRKRQAKLDEYLKQGIATTNRQVMLESLNVMGLNWMFQTELANRMVANRTGMMPLWHHRVGRMSQEEGYYIDVYAQTSGIVPSDWNTNNFNIAYPVLSYVDSALEHGVIEQMQGAGADAASTIKMLQIANKSNLWVYLATSNNYSTVKTLLTGYSAGQSNFFQSLMNDTNGVKLLLPSSGSISVSRWSGSGYVAAWSDSLAMLISGGYFGGFVFNTGQNNANNVSVWINSDQNSLVYYPSVAGAGNSFEPVNLADGAYWYEHTDLTIGGAEPRGLNFSRHYHSNRRFQNPAKLGYGWTHNYLMYATEQSSVKSGLGLHGAPAMAPFLAATTAALGVYSNSVTAKERLLTALIVKWAVDQLRTNAVNVILGKDIVEFNRMPDGSFVSSAGQTATLTNVSGFYKMQLRHGNTITFTNSTNALKFATGISNWYGQSLTFTYDTSNRLSTVKDAFSTPRTLTFTYNSSNLLSTVATSSELANRSITFTYDNNVHLTNYTDPESKSHTFIYDTNSLMTSLRDTANQILVTNLYDSSARVYEQWNEGNAGKVWKFYWGGDYCNIEEDPLGGRTYYLYDDKLRTTAIIDQNGSISQRFYDGQDHVTMTIGPSGETNRTVYDAFHNVTASYDPLGLTNTFGYDSQFHLVAATNSRGFVTKYGYNTQHDVVAVTNAGIVTNLFSYYAAGDSQAGLLRYSTNGDGLVTTNVYDAYGNPAVVLNPGGLSTNGFTYSARGDLLKTTNALGLVITYGYNARRELTNTVAVGFFTNKVVFDPAGNPAASVDGLGNTTSNTYSPSGLILTNYLPTLPAGSPVVIHLYDARGWKYSVVDPLNNTSQTVYDSAKRVISTQDPLTRSVGFAYDASGRQLAVTNPLQQVTRMTYNGRGEQVVVTNALNDRLAFVFDNTGNRVTVTNRNNNAFTAVYDAVGRITTNLTPTGKATVLAYNGRGLVTTNIEPSLQKTTNTYDALGRLTNRADSVANTTFRYNANNNVTHIVEAGKTNRFDYDQLGRLTNYVDSVNRTNGYAYDANGNLTKLYYAANGGAPVSYAYDSHNRLTNVLDWTSKQTRLEYDLGGRLTKITRPNGTVRQMDYDAAGQLTNIVEKLGNGTPIAAFKLQWDGAGRITNEFRAPLPHSWSAPTRTQVFDNDNRVTSFNSTTLTNDADGNLTWGPIRNGAAYAYTNFTYDARNRLVQGGAVSNVFDPAGNRISTRAGGVTNDFQVAPVGGVSQVLALYPSGGSGRNYIYGQGLLYELSGAGAGYYYHYDQRGSVVAVTDDSGNVIYRAEYSPYGTIIYSAGSYSTPFGYNGRYGVQTDSSGLLYMRARFYSPDLCRFLNADPIGFAGGWNVYAFADGNPVANVDPDGLQAIAQQFLWNYNAKQTPAASLLGTPAPGVVDNPAEGLLNFFIGGGAPATFGPNLIKSFQTIQSSTPFPITEVPINRRAYDDWAFFKHPIDVLRVGLTVGQFRYVNDGATTKTVDNVYSFPLVNSDWDSGGKSIQNSMLSPLQIIGQSYQLNDSWRTPPSSDLPNSSMLTFGSVTFGASSLASQSSGSTKPNK